MGIAPGRVGNPRHSNTKRLSFIHIKDLGELLTKHPVKQGSQNGSISIKRRL